MRDADFGDEVPELRVEPPQEVFGKLRPILVGAPCSQQCTRCGRSGRTIATRVGLAVEPGCLAQRRPVLERRHHRAGREVGGNCDQVGRSVPRHAPPPAPRLGARRGSPRASGAPTPEAACRSVRHHPVQHPVAVRMPCANELGSVIHQDHNCSARGVPKAKPATTALELAAGFVLVGYVLHERHGQACGWLTRHGYEHCRRTASKAGRQGRQRRAPCGRRAGRCQGRGAIRSAPRSPRRRSARAPGRHS